MPIVWASGTNAAVARVAGVKIRLTSFWLIPSVDANLVLSRDTGAGFVTVATIPVKAGIVYDYSGEQNLGPDGYPGVQDFDIGEGFKMEVSTGTLAGFAKFSRILQ